MMRAVPVIILLTFLVNSFFAQETKYFTVVKDGKWGVVNSLGEETIAPVYSALGDSRNNFVPFKENGSWGVMNLKGQIVIQPQYDYLSHYFGNRNDPRTLFLVKRDGKYGIADINNRLIAPIKFEEINLKELYFFGRINQKQYVGRQYEEVFIEKGFKEVVVTNHFILGRSEHESAVYNFRGELLRSEPKGFFSEKENMFCFHSGGLISLFDSLGTAVANPLKVIHEDVSLIWGYDSLEKEYVEVNTFYAAISYRSKYIPVTTIGSLRVFKDKDDYFRVLDQNQRVIDSSGKSYLQMGDFFLWSRKSDAYSVYDSNGSKKIQEEVSYFNLINGVYLMRTDRGDGVFNGKKVIVPPEYDRIEIYEDKIKAFQKGSGVVLYHLSSTKEVTEKQEFNNVISVDINADYPTMPRSFADVNGMVQNPVFSAEYYGWYKDSTWIDTAFYERWSIVNEHSDTLLRVKYVTWSPYDSSFSLARYNRPLMSSTINSRGPLNLPDVDGLYYYNRFDIMPRFRAEKTNKVPFCFIKFSGFRTCDFTTGLNMKGKILVDKQLNIIKDDFYFAELNINGLSRYCSSYEDLNYTDIVKPSTIPIREYFGNFSEFAGTAYANKGIEVEHGKWGYLSNTGEVKYEAVFDEAHSFNGIFGRVKLNEKYGAVNKDSLFIPVRFEALDFLPFSKDSLILVLEVPVSKEFPVNSLGEPIILDYKFEKCKNLPDSLILVKQDKKYGLMSRDGNWILEPVFSRKPVYLNDGFFIIKQKKLGIFNARGEMETDYIFDEIVAYQQGLVIYQKGNKLGVADANGTPIIPAIYTSVIFENDVFVCETKFSRQLFDTKGTMLHQDKWTYADYNPKSRQWIYVKKKHTYLTDSSGQVIHKFKDQNYPCKFLDDLLLFTTREGEYLLDPEDEMRQITNRQYDDIEMVEEGLYKVVKDKDEYLMLKDGTLLNEFPVREFYFLGKERYGMIYQREFIVLDKTGKELKRLKADRYYPSGDGFFILRTPEGFGYFNDKLENAFNEFFDAVQPFYGGYAAVKINAAWATINDKGEILMVPSYSKIIPMISDVLIAKSPLLEGLYDRSGKIILEPVYDKISVVDDEVIKVAKDGLVGYINPSGDWYYNPFNE